MLESSIVIYDDILIDVNVGEEYQVNFDFLRIWKFIKDYKKYGKKEFDSNLLNFYHVHLSPAINASAMDYNCMKGLYMGLNFPIQFHIINFCFVDPMNFSYEIKSYVQDQSGVHKDKIISSRYLKEEYAQLLKLLSYRGEE
jgi:hypothetical protein